MSRLVVTEFVSVDGVMEDPGGSEGTEHGGWALRYPSPEGGKFKLDELMSSGSQLLGRVTYEGFAAAWPSRTDEAGFAEKMNTMPKYVVSTTLDTAGWENSTVISGDVPAAVRELKAQPGDDILVAGSLTLVRALLENGLVDELRLMVFPVVLGSGRRLFAEAGAMTELTLAEARPLSSGVVILTYHQAVAAPD